GTHTPLAMQPHPMPGNAQKRLEIHHRPNPLTEHQLMLGMGMRPFGFNSFPSVDSPGSKTGRKTATKRPAREVEKYFAPMRHERPGMMSSPSEGDGPEVFHGEGRSAGPLVREAAGFLVRPRATSWQGVQPGPRRPGSRRGVENGKTFLPTCSFGPRKTD